MANAADTFSLADGGSVEAAIREEREVLQPLKERADVSIDTSDLSAARLIDRKLALEGLLGPVVDARSPIQISDHIDGDGEALFVMASRMGLEGTIAKKADARYVQGRTSSWVKVKRVDVATFAVIGFLSRE